MRSAVRLVVALALGIALTWAIGVRPAGGAELATDYPSVKVRPGDTSTFEVQVVSATRERVDLSLDAVPAGWQARLLGEGREVNAVITDPDPAAAPTVDVEVVVPADVAPGSYAFTLTAVAPSGTTSLPLELVVAEQVAAPFELTADFPELSGEADQTFTFDVDVRNNTGRDATFAIEASGPQGWTVQARPTSESQAATLTVAGGETGSLSVTVSPDPNATEGQYPIDVEVLAEGQTAAGQFQVVIVGAPELALATANERLSVSGDTGDTTTVPLVVSNRGSAPLTEVTFSASAPTDWEVSFVPETVASIEPGDQATVEAQIRPPSGAVNGDYSITLTARSEGSSQNVDLRFKAETSTMWGFVAAGVIVLAVAALALVFRRFGRR